MTDSEQTLTWLEMLFDPDDIFEVRVKTNEQGGAQQSWYTMKAKGRQFATTLAPIHEQNRRHVWVGVAPRDRVGSSSPTVLRALWVDLNASITTLAEAEAALSRSGLPRPTMIVNSGNGFHLYWKLKQPLPAQHARPWTRGVHDALPTDSTHDPTRVMRVPGTANVKDPVHPKRCTIVEHDPERVYELEKFPKAKAEVTNRPGAAPTPSPSRLKQEDFDLFVANWLDGQKHSMAVGVAGYLRKNLAYSQDECEAEVARIHEAAGYQMDDNLRKVVKDTYDRPYAMVAGLNKLRELGVVPSVRDSFRLVVKQRPKPRIEVIDFSEDGDDQKFWVDGLVGPGLLTLWAAEPKTGKAQKVSGGVLTPHGWVPMGSLRPGDEVIAGDGTPTRVTQVHPQGVQDIYRVTFLDGTHVDVTSDHLWAVRERSNGGRVREAVLSTKEIASSLQTPDGKNRYSVPFPEPVQFRSGPVPLDPYTLGVLLGDGGFRGANPTLVNQEGDIIRRLRRHLPGLHLGSDGRTWRWDSAMTEEALKRLGLWGLASHEKFIPDAYQYGDVDTRISVLRGLLDADGSVTRPNTSLIEYSTTSPQLRDDVTFLARSLGAKVTVTGREGRYRKDGEYLPAKLNWRVLITPHPQHCLVSSDKHLARYRPKRKPHRNAIVSVEFSHREAAQCITVEHPSHLYVAEGFNVTHNSFAAMQIGYALASGTPLWDFETDPTPKRVLYFQGELTHQMVRQRARNMFGLASVRDPRRFAMTGKPAKPINLVEDPEVLLDLAEDYDVVIVDPISVFNQNDETSSHSVNEVISVFDPLRADGKAVILVHHTRKMQSDKDGNPISPSFNDVRGSSAWFATADALALHYKVGVAGNTEVKFVFRAAPDRDKLTLYRLPNGSFTHDRGRYLSANSTFRASLPASLN